jgi:hypothetical protein
VAPTTLRIQVTACVLEFKEVKGGQRRRARGVENSGNAVSLVLSHFENQTKGRKWEGQTYRQLFKSDPHHIWQVTDG